MTHRTRALIETLKPKKHIFLLSHMRCYTSLFGHLLGDHPAIDGYFEMHIGYYSWRSLYRQRLLYYREHAAKPGAQYIFDKILHNEHHASPEILSRTDVFPVFSIRMPEPSVASIVEHYERRYPEHPYTKAENAEAYYKVRIEELARLALRLQGRYFFFPAEDLVDATDGTLERIAKYLQLTTSFTGTYSTREKTGVPKHGDSSPNLHAGHVLSNRRATGFSVSAGVQQTYEHVLKSLRAGSAFLN